MGLIWMWKSKDTWKHKQQALTMMVGPELVGLLVNQPMRLSLAELCKRFTPEADIALAEGFSWEAVPKILVAQPLHLPKKSRRRSAA